MESQTLKEIEKDIKELKEKREEYLRKQYYEKNISYSTTKILDMISKGYQVNKDCKWEMTEIPEYHKEVLKKAKEIIEEYENGLPITY